MSGNKGRNGLISRSNGMPASVSGEPVYVHSLVFSGAATKTVTLNNSSTKTTRWAYDSSAATVGWDRGGGTAAIPVADAGAANDTILWPGAGGTGGENVEAIVEDHSSQFSVVADAAITITIVEFTE